MWLVKIVGMISFFPMLIVLWWEIRFTLYNVSCAPDKNMYSVAGGWKILCMSVRSIDRRYSSSFIFLLIFFGWSIHCWKWDINYYYCIYVYFFFQIGYICLLYLGALTFGIYNYIFLMNQPLCPFIMTFFVSLQFLNFLSLSTSLGHLCKATLQVSSRRQWSHKIELESLSHYSEERPNNTENSFWTLW